MEARRPCPCTVAVLTGVTDTGSNRDASTLERQRRRRTVQIMRAELMVTRALQSISNHSKPEAKRLKDARFDTNIAIGQDDWDGYA